MSQEEVCCSCPGLRAFCQGLFTSPDKTEAEKPTNTAKQTVNVPNPSRASACEPGSELYKALWSYKARGADELSFQEGEQFRICERQGEWWTALKLGRDGAVTGRGFVPNHFLARRQTVKEQPWYFGTLNRFETEILLLAPENDVGAFLVRHSEKDNIGYVLSVLSGDRSREVKHIKIHQNQNESFYLDKSQTFQSLEKLVDYYWKYSLDGDSFLKQPCRRPEPKPKDLSHSTVNDWELPKEEFTLEEELGKGFFADVYRGKWKGMVNVAIKILKNDSINHREFMLETQILKKLRHKHLIALFAVCTSSSPFYIITELMEKGDLLSLLKGKEGQDLNAQMLTEMASQVADGMAYLEEQNSIHRDLAARNVLVGANYICKVADLGLARIVKESVYSSEDAQIPYKWSAPEAISHGRFSNKSDVWSFGVLLYEMFTYGGVPYPAFSNIEVYNMITSGYRMPAPPNCPSHIYDIMLMCWRYSAEERPDFSELLRLLEDYCAPCTDQNTESCSGT
ncbi:protein-tyrosine kinase 6 [Danio rerio]|uniref:Tyrosine-protein kinase n=1 Tax=Danio rerio TaxID=7955 RepID=A0A8N7TED1_DANRE